MAWLLWLQYQVKLMCRNLREEKLSCCLLSLLLLTVALKNPFQMVLCSLQPWMRVGGGKSMGKMPSMVDIPLTCGGFYTSDLTQCPYMTLSYVLYTKQKSCTAHVYDHIFSLIHLLPPSALLSSVQHYLGAQHFKCCLGAELGNSSESCVRRKIDSLKVPGGGVCYLFTAFSMKGNCTYHCSHHYRWWHSYDQQSRKQSK